MGADYSIVREHRLVHMTLAGRLTDSDLLAVQARMRSDRLFRPDYCQVVDATGLSEVAVTLEGLCATAAGTVFGTGSRRAMVAPSDVAYAMGRMYKKLRGDSPDRLEVFKEWAEAVAWLDLSGWTAPEPALAPSPQT
ncbi:hypothetical protein [Longimicrobium sp.]|uniref:hypothetical protein n=1 Tax=Longimicrobium sp. TaxID=2029185 RepID=UPI002BD493FA|nr:hypothetical protein [Longimicrobium sp.]HSU15620.1 hypothetical protein [Longimicrobium sp.]